MKRTIKMLCAAAASAIALTALPITDANAIYQETTIDAMADWTQLDDGGMFSQFAWNGTTYRDYAVYQNPKGQLRAAIAVPCEYAFILRENTDAANAAVQAVLQEVYPETAAQPFVDAMPYDQTVRYTVYDNSAEKAAANAKAVFRKLNSQNLISVFHDCGQIFSIMELYSESTFCTYFNDVTDEEKLKAWIADQNLSVKFTSDAIFVHVVPVDDDSFAAQFALAKQIYQELGYAPTVISPETASNDFGYGINLVELRGDANGDGLVNIADAILTSRYTANEIVPISEQGVKNIDCNADTLLTQDDVTEILKIIARI